MQTQYARELCPACFDDRELDAALLENAAEYAAGLPEDLCASDEAYAERLRRCADCTFLARGVCAKCGCFVLVRARRRKQDCPLEKSRWMKDL